MAQHYSDKGTIVQRMKQTYFIYFDIIVYDDFVLFLPLRVLGAYIREYRIISLLTSKYFFDDTLVMNNHL